MRKSYTFGIPFGLQRESGLFLDITEVSRGIDCNCICPACKTDLLAKQGEVKLWHFSHSTAVAGDCDGLMEAIRGKIIEVINEHQVLGFPNLLAGDDGGPVSLNEVIGSGSMFGGTADLFVKVNDLCVAVFLDRDRSISAKLTFDHLHPSERVAALRIDLPDIEYEISQVQLGRRKTTYSECIESLIIDETSSREWLYHPLMHELESEPLQEYRGREPSEEGPLLQRLADCKMKFPAMAATGDKLQRLLVFRQHRHVLLATLLAQTAEGFLQPRLFYRFQKIIKGMLLKGLNRVFVKSGQKNNIRTMLRVKHTDHFQPADTRHLNIQKQHVRMQSMHRANRFNGVGALAYDRSYQPAGRSASCTR